MWANGWVFRNFRFTSNDSVQVHLGPGQKNYLDGWLNLDANIFTAKCDLWVDLRNALPFPNGTVDAFYSHHVVEHLPDLRFHFAEVCRCLRSGGVYRVGGPNGDSAIKKFVEKDGAWFPDWPDVRSSIGGKFENFIFCEREHVTILTYSYLEELMTEAGFRHVQACLPARDTGYPEIFCSCLEKESESDFDSPHTLIVEGRKP